MAFDISKKIAFILSVQDDDKVKTAVRGVNEGLYDTERAVGLAQKAFVGLVGIASASAFIGMVKGSIDATAGLHDLSIQTGMSVAALAQFRSIGALSETSAEGIAGATNKLSKNLALTNEEGKGAALALKALGIDFDSFKRLTPEQQLLQVASSMGEFRDGSDKTAASMLLFGKEGAKLLPFLADLAEQADKVSAKLTDQEKETRRLQAAMADAFGDNLTKIRKESDGWKKDISMGLLPALYEASEAVLGMSGGTGGLKAQISALAKDGTLADWARGAMTALSYLLDVGQGLFSLLPMLGKVIAGVAASGSVMFAGVFAAMAKLKSGDVTGAWDSLKGGFAGVATVATATGEDIADVWGQKLLGQTFRDRMTDLRGVDATGQETRRSMSNLSSVMEGMEAARQRNAEAAKAAAEAEKKLIAEYERAHTAGLQLIDTLVKKQTTLDQELAQGRKLSDAEKELIDLEDKLRTGKIVLSAAEEQHARSLIASNAQLESNVAWMKQATDENNKNIDTIGKRTEALLDEVEKQQRATDAALGGKAALEALEAAKQRDLATTTGRTSLIGDEESQQLRATDAAVLGKHALELLEAAKLHDQATSAERNAQMAETWDMEGNVTAEFRRQAEALRTLADLKEQGIHIKAAQESAAEWKKTTDSIYTGLTDSLYRAFESGKDFFGTLWSGIKNTFKTTVLKVGVQAVMNPINSLLGGLLGTASGGASAGTAGGGGSGLLGNLGSLATLGSSLATFGATAMGGFEALMAGNGLAALSGAGAAITGGSIAGGLGLAAGVLGPIVLGGIVLSNLMSDKSAKLGYAGGQVDGAGNYSQVTGRMLSFGNGDASYNSGLQSYLDTITQTLQATSQGLGGYTNNVQLFAGTDVDRKGLGAGTVHVLQNGQSVGGVQTGGTDPSSTAATKIAAGDLNQWFQDASSQVLILGLQNSVLPKRFAEYFDAVQASALTKAQADEMLSTAAAAKGLSDTLAPLGGIFGQLGGLSVNASAALIKLAGGLDVLVSKAQGYVGAFYSDQEQAALTASAVQRALKAAGIGTDISSKEQFRALVDSQGSLETEDARKRLVALLDVATSFAGIADVLASSGLTLSQLAAQAPGGYITDALVGGSSADNSTAALANNAAQQLSTLGNIADLSSQTNLQLQALVRLQQEQATQQQAQLEAMLQAQEEANWIARNVREVG